MFRAARNILRLISIARILARHDALFVLDLLGLGPTPARLNVAVRADDWPEVLLDVLGALGAATAPAAAAQA